MSNDVKGGWTMRAPTVKIVKIGGWCGLPDRFMVESPEVGWLGRDSFVRDLERAVVFPDKEQARAAIAKATRGTSTP